MRIAYNWREKKVFGILALNLSNLQLSHIYLYKTSTKVWAKLWNIREAKKLANILFLKYNFFTVKMEEDDGMLAHINKVKALVDELNGGNVAIIDENIDMTFLDIFPPLYEYLIVARKADQFKSSLFIM